MTRKSLIIALAIINFGFSTLVWLKWGGIGNDMGTFIFAMWLCLSNSVLARKW